MKQNKLINYKVGYENQFKRFTIDTEQTNFKEFCEKCYKAFSINPDHTILVNFQENDKQLIIRNEVDFALAVHANIYNTKQKSISFKISAVPAETKLNESQVVDSRFNVSLKRGGAQSDVEISKEDIQILLELGLNHPDSDVILNKIVDSIPQNQEQIQIKFSTVSNITEVIKQRIQGIRFLKQQSPILQNDLSKQNFPSLKENDLEQNLENKNIFESNYNQNRLSHSLVSFATPTPQGFDNIDEQFNSSIASSTHNLKQSFENIFQQFNQSIQQLSQSVRISLQSNKEGVSQQNKYSNSTSSNNNRESEKQKKVNAFDQLTMLTEFLDNIDEEVDNSEKQLIEEQDQENVVLSNIKDKIAEHTNILNRVQKKQSHEKEIKPTIDLFDGIIKHVDHGIDKELEAPFANKNNNQNEESAYQKIFNQTD